MKYGAESQKNWRNAVITQLGGIWLFLEDCLTSHNNKYFPDLVEQAIEEYQNIKNGDAGQAGFVRKETREVSKPEIIKLGEKYFFIAGNNNIFHLNHVKAEDDKFARKLTKEEIDDLHVEIIWTGSEQIMYEDDEKTAFTILCSIIEKMNHMQDPQFYSFPLGRHCTTAC